MRLVKPNRIVNALLFTLLGLSTISIGISPARAQAMAVPPYTVADFATGFKNGGEFPGVGPLGLASDPLGNLYVADIVSGNVFKFSHTPGQVAVDANVFVSNSTISTLFPGFRPHGMTFGKDGNLYLNLVHDVNLNDGKVVQIDITPGSPTIGKILRTVNNIGLHWPSGLASDPISGDLFVSDSAGAGRTPSISRIDVATGRVDSYITFPGGADGLAFDSRGTLYAVAGTGVSTTQLVRISGTDKGQPANSTLITPVGNPQCPDGVAISLDLEKPFVYTNNACGGTITRIDNVNCAPLPSCLVVSDIVTNGSRGDFVTVGSDDCIYATQTDRILVVGNSVSSCRFSPLGPLVQNHPSIVQEAFHSSAAVPITTGGSVPRGSSVYDTAQVAEVNGIIPTGNVTYAFFNNTACSGAGTSQTVNMTSTGSVPNSRIQASLLIGDYSFRANYTGDTHYSPSTTSCNSFSAALVTTGPFASKGVSIPLGGFAPNGIIVHDTATVTGVPGGPTPNGTLTYTFFNNGACSGSGTPQTVTLSGGLAPNSTMHGPLAVGFYSFNANYSGNYPSSTSSCEFFIVDTYVTTVLFTSAGASISTGGTVLPGTSVYDTAKVIAQSGAIPTGTVTYKFYANGVCSGSGNESQTVTLTSTGTVPNSTLTGSLAIGPYSFNATYSGDSNNLGSTSTCEPFNVGLGGSVGGSVVPVDKLALLAPYIVIVIVTFAVAIPTLYLVRVRGRKRNGALSNNPQNG